MLLNVIDVDYYLNYPLMFANTEKGKTEIEATFKITGRGIVFVGNIIEGNFEVGNTISFCINGKQENRTIIGFEMINKLNSTYKTGILIKTENQEEIEALRNWNPNGTIATIHSQIENQD